MRFRQFLLSLLLSAFSIMTFGQKDFRPGYIISNSSDTVRGYINLKSNYQNSRSCEFKAENETDTKIYQPGEIYGYRIENNKFYISREITLNEKKQVVFLEYLLHGIVDLFYLNDSGSSYYFIEKNGTLYELSNDEKEVFIEDTHYLKKSYLYVGVLNMVFQDAPVLFDEIRNTPFSYKRLVNLTRDYHNTVCKDQKCIDYTKSTTISMFLEATAGMGFSWMGLETSPDYGFSFVPLGGITLRFIPFVSHDAWNFKTGLLFSYNNLSGSYKNELSGFSAHPLDITTRYTFLRIPLTLEYNLHASKVQPFFSAGIVNNLLLDPHYEIWYTDLNGTFPIPSAFRKYQAGVSLGAGIRINFKNSRYLFVMNEAEFRRPVVNLNEVLDFHRVYSDMLTIGYGFKIK